MHLRITKERLISVLLHVVGVVERRHTINILSNVKFQVSRNALTIVGSDLEVELIATVSLKDGECLQAGDAAIPARKLMDICKSLPNSSIIDLQITEDQRCILKSGSGRFVLGTLKAEDYPLLTTEPVKGTEIQVVQKELKRMFEKTAFAMAVQDVRFYLTGTLLEVEQNQIRAVTTDGHRLALCESVANVNVDGVVQAIIPRKAVAELQRLLSLEETALTISINAELLHITIHVASKEKEQADIEICFTTKLINGKFPDYRKVIPRSNDKQVVLNHSILRQALQRVSILSNEKLHGVLLNFSQDNLQLKAHNPEQDEAYEDLIIHYDYDALEMSFNALYLLHVLDVLDGDDVHIYMTETNAAVLVKDPNAPEQTYVVMPMRN